jgi:ketosteroid isomerase-like protein
MKNFLSVIPLVFLLCFVVGCQRSVVTSAVDIAAEEAAVREAFETQNKAGLAKDVDLFMSGLAEDVVLTGTGGKDKIREWYSNWFSEGNYWDKTTIDKIGISSSGDIAYLVCRWENFNDEGSRGRGSNVFVMKKQADGTWKLVAF